MQPVQTELIERYQIMLQQDPKSRVFAPLAEAYRKLGWFKQAEEICLSGIKHNPSFAGGHIALARVFLDVKEPVKAAKELKKATELSPENILAYSLLAETLLKLKDGKGALKAYKMLLFLNPQHEKAQQAVSKLESLTADEFDEDIFAMQPLKTAADGLSETAVPIEPIAGPEEKRQWRDLDRFISLTDAFLIRNDVDRALETIREAERIHGQHPEVKKRLKMLTHRNQEDEPEPTPAPMPRKDQQKQEKIARLKGLLKQVRERRAEKD